MLWKLDHEFCAHGEHAAAPTPLEYVPAAQTSQFHGSPKRPAAQFSAQSEAASLPAAAVLPGAHCRHVVSLLAATAGEYLPFAHRVQAPEPAALLYDPTAHAAHSPPTAAVYPGLHRHAAEVPVLDHEFAGHASHSLAPPTAEYVPAAQSVQTLATAAPAVVAYLPAAHSTHAEAVPAAAVVEYLPAAHAVHSRPASEYVPAMQSTQAVTASAADGADFPAKQLAHAADPVTALYFPAAHAVHAAPSAPVKPRLHVHAVCAADASAD